MSNILDLLTEPFDPDDIKWRVGSTNRDKTRGMALAYIDARNVMQRLDAVFGSDWSDDYQETASGRVLCRLSLKIDGEWITRVDGAGDTSYEGEKGGISDAFKRAAVKWGIGRYLYDLPAPWVEVEARGNTVLIKDSEKQRLAGYLSSGKPTASPKKTVNQPKPPEPATWDDIEAHAATNADSRGDMSPEAQRERDPRRVSKPAPAINNTGFERGDAVTLVIDNDQVPGIVRGVNGGNITVEANGKLYPNKAASELTKVKA